MELLGVALNLFGVSLEPLRSARCHGGGISTRVRPFSNSPTGEINVSWPERSYADVGSPGQPGGLGSFRSSLLYWSPRLVERWGL